MVIFIVKPHWLCLPITYCVLSVHHCSHHWYVCVCVCVAACYAMAVPLSEEFIGCIVAVH